MLKQASEDDAEGKKQIDQEKLIQLLVLFVALISNKNFHFWVGMEGFEWRMHFAIFILNQPRDCK